MKKSKIVNPQSSGIGVSSDFAGLARLVEDLADTMSFEYRYETALAYAMEELKKSGNEIAVSRIRRFVKCKRFSTLPADLKRLVRKGKKNTVGITKHP